MVLRVRLEMILELEDTLAENGNLNFGRTGVVLEPLIIRDNLGFQIRRQCHARVNTPRLTLIFVLFLYKRNTVDRP